MTASHFYVNQRRMAGLLFALVMVVALGACRSAPPDAADRSAAAGAAAVWNPDDAGLNTALLQRRVWEGRLRGPIAQRVRPKPQPQSQPDSVAYVNLRGPSDIRDWRLCESRTGGAFVLGPRGAATAPDFDACLRGLGYLPEPEALELMGQVADG